MVERQTTESDLSGTGAYIENMEMDIVFAEGEKAVQNGW